MLWLTNNVLDVADQEKYLVKDVVALDAGVAKILKKTYQLGHHARGVMVLASAPAQSVVGLARKTRLNFGSVINFVSIL